MWGGHRESLIRGSIEVLLCDLDVWYTFPYFLLYLVVLTEGAEVITEVFLKSTCFNEESNQVDIKLSNGDTVSTWGKCLPGELHGREG